MKWTYSIKGKFTAAILLAIILGLTMLTNLVERKRFRDLEQSFSSIYEDRLLPESYLFSLLENLNKEQDLLQLVSTQGADFTTQEHLLAFKTERNLLIEKYSKTYLTELEEAEFNHLTNTVKQLNELGKEIIVSPTIPKLFSTHHEVTSEAFSTLAALSEIQTTEGTLLRNQSRKIILGSISTSHFEMIVLIIIAIMIQALVFSSKTIAINRNQQSSLN